MSPDPEFAAKLKTIQFGKVAGSEAMTKRDKVLDQDLAAYKRLRHNGVQPAHINGCAAIEKGAKEKIEIERMTLMSAPIRKELRARLARAKENA